MLYKTKTFKPKGYLTFLLVTTTEKCTIPYLATFAVTLKGKRNSWGVFIIIISQPFGPFLYKVVLFILSLEIKHFQCDYLRWKVVSWDNCTHNVGVF